MADFLVGPIDYANSRAAAFNADSRLSNPFVAANFTSWTECIASTSAALAGFWVHMRRSTTKGILVVGVGPSGSESIIAILPVQKGRSATNSIFCPVPIASGTRVAIAASTESGGQIIPQFMGIKASVFDSTPSFSIMESGPYNLVNGSSYGDWIDVDPGAVANTKGGWVELSNAYANNVIQGGGLVQAYDWIGMLCNGNFNPTNSNQHVLLDLATGASGSENILMPDIYSGITTTENPTINEVMWTPSGALLGTRFAARAQSSITDSTDRIQGALLFGLR